MNKHICTTDTTTKAKLDQVDAQYQAEKLAEQQRNLAIMAEYDKYIPEVAYCIAGCVKPTEATEGMFPYVKGGRIHQDSLLAAICWAKALELGLTFEDNPYSHNYGKFSDGSSGVLSFVRHEYREEFKIWEEGTLLPTLEKLLGRRYKRIHDGDMFGDYWYVPDDETMGEYLTYSKQVPYIFFFFPLFGQIYLVCVIWAVIYALFTKKWFGASKQER